MDYQERIKELATKFFMELLPGYQNVAAEFMKKGRKLNLFIGEHVSLAEAYLMLRQLQKAEESVVLAFSYNEKLWNCFVISKSDINILLFQCIWYLELLF